MILIEICRILVKVQNYLDEVRQNTNSWNGIQVLHPRAAPGMQGGMAPLLSLGCVSLHPTVMSLLCQHPGCAAGTLESRDDTWESGVELWL